MIKVKLFDLNIGEIIIRFYLFMLAALILGYMRQWILMPFLAGPIAISALMGARFSLGSLVIAFQTRKLLQLDLSA